MSLSDWLADGAIKPQVSNRTEILRLLAIVDRDLTDASVTGLSVDRGFATAYEAGLQLATIVLRASGYRASASTGGHHWRTIALLTELMGPEQSERARYLDSCRRARHQADYDRTGVASADELAELLDDMRTFRVEVLEWLQKHHAELL